jgi:uncharacterized Zn-finger protein
MHIYFGKISSGRRRPDDQRDGGMTTTNMNMQITLLLTQFSYSSLQEHLAKHSGDKPYKCEVCPKQFNHKTDLRRHMCLHTGEKPFSCEVCGKGFIREDRMVKHSDTHKKKQPILMT